MPHPRYSTHEIVQKGQHIINEHLRGRVETPENVGREIVIDIETGDYEIDANGLDASRRLLERRPGAALYGARIGYDAVYTLGGALRRTVEG